MSDSRKEIEKKRIVLLASISQTLILYEHIKGIAIIILRELIFPNSTSFQNSVVRALIDRDDIRVLSNKLIAMFDLKYPAEKEVKKALKKMLQKLEELSSVRNKLAHSRSTFVSLPSLTDEDTYSVPNLDQIQVKIERLANSGFLQRSEGIDLDFMNLLNENARKLESAFLDFLFALGDSNKMQKFLEDSYAKNIMHLKFSL